MKIEEIMRRFGPAPQPGDISIPYKAAKLVRPGMIAPCQLCGKSIEILAQKFSRTDQVTGAYDVICDSCARNYNRTARLVCIVCRQVVARLKPRKTDTGFEIRADTFYHTDQCNICAPGLKVSSILEIKAFEALNKK